MKAILFFSTLVLAFSLTLKAQNNPDAICGKWWTEGKRAVIEISKKNGKYFGKLIESKEAYDEKGNVKKDKENPNPALRDRPVIGINILFDFVYAGDNLWEDGKAYDPESGNTYSAKIEMVDKNTLEMRGYIGISLFGRTETWKRKQ